MSKQFDVIASQVESMAGHWRTPNMPTQPGSRERYEGTAETIAGQLNLERNTGLDPRLYWPARFGLLVMSRFLHSLAVVGREAAIATPDALAPALMHPATISIVDRIAHLPNGVATGLEHRLGLNDQAMGPTALFRLDITRSYFVAPLFLHCLEEALDEAGEGGGSPEGQCPTTHTDAFGRIYHGMARIAITDPTLVATTLRRTRGKMIETRF